MFRALLTNQVEDPVQMVRQNPHAAEIQRIENRAGEPVASKSRLDIVLSQEINGAACYKVSETVGTDAVCLALVHEGDGRRGGFQRKRDGCGLPVIEGLSRGAGHEVEEMPCPSVSKRHDLHSPRSMPPVQRGSVVSAGLQAAFKLQRDFRHNEKWIRQSVQNRFGTLGGIQINHHAGVCDDGNGPISQAALAHHPPQLLPSPLHPESRATEHGRDGEGGQAVPR